MDRRRRVELQLRSITTTYHREKKRLDPASLTVFRARAGDILAKMRADASHHDDLAAALANVFEELERDERLARDRLGQQPLDGVAQLIDRERLSQNC